MEMIDSYLTVGFLRLFGLLSLQIQMSKMLTTTDNTKLPSVGSWLPILRSHGWIYHLEHTFFCFCSTFRVSFQFCRTTDAVDLF